MPKDSNAELASQEEARKNLYTGMIQKSMAAIPSDLSAGQKASITSAEMGGLDAGYGTMRDQIERQAAATGSSSGIPESLSEIGRQQVRDKAQAGQQLAETFANTPVQRALQQASVYQPGESGLLFDRYPAQGPSTLGKIFNAAGAGLGAYGKAAGVGGTAGTILNTAGPILGAL